MGGKRRKRSGPSGSRAVAIEPPAERSSLGVTFSNGILDTTGWVAGNGSTEAVALSVDALYACVRLIADGVSSADWGEWRGLDKLPSSRIARRPMQRLTRRDWTWRVAATMALYNVCPVRLVGGVDNEGVPWSVVPLNPGILTRDPAGKEEYRYGQETIPPDELRFIVRANFPSLTPQLAAILSLARAQIEAAASAAVYAGDWWSSGGAPLVVLTTDQELTKDQGEAIAERWIERRALGPSSPAVLGKGAKAEPFGANVGTSDAGAAQDRLLASIARYFGVPASYVNVPSFAGNLTYQNVEQAGLDLVRYTFSAYSEPIGDVLSDLLPGDYIEGRSIRLSLAGLTRGGQAERYTAYESALRAGWLTKDEIRTAEGYPPSDELEAVPVPESVPLEAAI